MSPNDRVKATIESSTSQGSPPLRTSRDRKQIPNDARRPSHDDSIFASSPPRIRRKPEVENMDMATRRASIFRVLKEDQEHDQQSQPHTPLTPSNVNPHPAQALNATVTSNGNHIAHDGIDEADETDTAQVKPDISVVSDNPTTSGQEEFLSSRT